MIAGILAAVLMGFIGWMVGVQIERVKGWAH